MGEFFQGCAIVTFFGAMIWFGEGCSEESTKESIIKAGEFCVEADSSGIKFKKCFEVKEKPAEKLNG